jgi:hypothetical protein
MHYSRYRQSDFLEAASALLQCAVNDLEVSKSMAEVGFGEKNLVKGEALLSDFRNTYLKHESVTGEKLNVNNRRMTHLKSMKKLYMRILKTARIAFQDDQAAKNDMCLDGERHKDGDLWIGQVEQLCTGFFGVPGYSAKLEQFGVDSEMVGKLQSDIAVLKSINETKKVTEEELLLLTRQKKESVLKFQKWLSNYVKMARIRFDNNPDVLRRMGVIS